MNKLFNSVIYIYLLLLLFALLLYPNYVHAKTQVILADITSVEPIYLNHSLEKSVAPCMGKVIQQDCWRFNYTRNNTKSLKGFRVTLSYNGYTFISRTSSIPEVKQLLIRVRGDYSHTSDANSSTVVTAIEG